MRSAARWVARFVAVGLLGICASQTWAATITVVATGTILTFDDSNSVTDGSIAVGTPYTAAITYPDSVLDLDPDPRIGGYFSQPAQSSHTIVVGNYTIDAASSLAIGLLDGFNGPTMDELVWNADLFSVTGPLDPGVSVVPSATTYALLELIDYTGTAFSSDQLAVSVWNRSLFSQQGFPLYAFIEVLDPRTTGRDYIEFFASVDAFLVTVPEPSVPEMLALACAAALALRRLARGS
jgi:hypothetical protein